MTQYCHRCGKTSESLAQMRFCPHCGAPYEEPLGQPPTGATPDQGGISAGPQAIITGPGDFYIPWEDKGKLGFLGSLYETWKQSCFDPSRFFRKMPIGGGILNPLLYGLILSFVGYVFQMVYMQLFGQLLDFSQWMPSMYRSLDSELMDFRHWMQSYYTFFSLFLFPFIVTAGFFIWSGIVHLILTIFNWKKHDFESTFRLVVYSEGPTFFRIIPFIGDLTAIIWQLVLVIIGIKEVHKTSTGQALLVVFLPLILFCLCCCGLAFWLIGLAGIAN
jgi:hypothetical protein